MMSTSNASSTNERAFSVQTIYLQAGQVACFLVVEGQGKCTMYHVSPAEATLLEALLGHISLVNRDTGESVQLLAALCDPDVFQLREYIRRAFGQVRQTGMIRRAVMTIPGSREYCVTKNKWDAKPSLTSKMNRTPKKENLLKVIPQQNAEDRQVFPPFQWLTKHDDILRLVFEPGSIDRVQAYLAGQHLLVCSEDWLQQRLEELGVVQHQGSKQL